MLWAIFLRPFGAEEPFATESPRIRDGSGDRLISLGFPLGAVGSGFFGDFGDGFFLGVGFCGFALGLVLFHRDEVEFDVGADGAAGADEGVDREVVGTGEHGSDARGLDFHAPGQFGAGDALLFHEAEQLVDDPLLAVFRLALDGERAGEEIGVGIVSFPAGVGDFHGSMMMGLAPWLFRVRNSS